jgi:hypothetical protein
MTQSVSGWTLARMKKDPDRSAERKACHYRITVWGELSQRFVESLEQVFVESAGDKSILRCDVADQAKLRAVLDWLYARGVDIVSVVPDDGSPDCGHP